MVVPSQASQELLDRLLLKESIVEFYNREYSLLDTRDFSTWLNLFAPEATYTIPIQRNVRFDRLNTASLRGELDTAWVADVKDTLTQRVEQLRTGVHWAEEPASRTVHIVTNVRILSVTGEAGAQIAAVGSCFIVSRNRSDHETDLFVGHREDKLRAQGADWHILERVVLLEQSVLQAKNLTTFF